MSSRSRSKSSSSSELSSAVRWLQQNVEQNRRCFECGRQGVTSVDLTTGSFVCTRCAGVLRGVPHKIKSIAMSSFSNEEIDFLRARGNQWARLVHLGLLGDKELQQLLTDDSDEGVRKRVLDKYEKQRYYVDVAQVPLSKLELPASLSGSGQNNRHHFIGAALNAKLGSHSVDQPSTSVATTKPVRRANSPATVILPKPSVLPSPGQIASPKTRKSSTSSSMTSQENFADFDAARFDQPIDLIAAPPRRSESARLEPTSLARHTAQSPPILTHAKPQEDRYAALKDLDDLFKTNLSVDKDESKSTTGASIFGVPADSFTNCNPVNTIATDQQSQGATTPFASTNTHVPSNEGVPKWGSSSHEAQWPSQGANIAQWGATGGAKVDGFSSRVGSNEEHVPFNPFVNLAGSSANKPGVNDGDKALNTSPWPSTGSSTTTAPPGFVADFSNLGNELDNGKGDGFKNGNLDFFNKSNDLFGNNSAFGNNSINTDLFSDGNKNDGNNKNDVFNNASNNDLFGNNGNTVFNSDPFATSDASSGFSKGGPKSKSHPSEASFDAFFNKISSSASPLPECQVNSNSVATTNFANFEQFDNASNPWSALDAETKLESQAPRDGVGQNSTALHSNNPFL